MHQVNRHLLGAVCLAAFVGTSIPGAEVYAQAAGGCAEALGRIETEVTGAVQTAKIIVLSIVTLALSVLIVKFARGDPDSWEYAFVAMGGLTIFVALKVYMPSL